MLEAVPCCPCYPLIEGSILTLEEGWASSSADSRLLAFVHSFEDGISREESSESVRAIAGQR